MANIVDYINWRGDLSFKVCPFNEIDALILTQLAMIDFEGIVSAFPDTEEIKLREAADKYFLLDGEEKKTLGLIIPGDIIPMFKSMSVNKRYSDMRLCAYVNHVSTDTEKQFAALTVKTGDGSFVIFRGTDDTLVGWKEDLNLSFLEAIPSQKEAVEYLDCIGRSVRGVIRVGGHSKGGNLSVYAAVKCRDSVRKKIKEVYNFDGPGFSKDFLSLQEYQSLDGRIRTIVPQSSIVGMLFENDSKYSVVKSTESGLLQHNALSWETEREGLVRLPELTEESRRITKEINALISDLDNDARRSFADAVYGVMISTNATTLTELYKDKMTVLRSMSKTDKETRRLVIKILGLIMKDGGGQMLSVILNSMFKGQHEIPKTDKKSIDTKSKKNG